MCWVDRKRSEVRGIPAFFVEMLVARDDHVRPCAGGRSRDDVVTREIPATYPSPAGSSLMVRVVSRTTAFLIAFSTFREIKPTAGQGRNLCDVLRVIELSFQEIPAFSISLPWLDSENVLSSILGKRYLSLQLEE